jgi:hypothetical protein
MRLLGLLDAADGCDVFGPDAQGLEVSDGTSSGLLTRCFLGGVQGFEGAELRVCVVDGDEAGEAGAGLVVSVGGLGSTGGALELCVLC